MTGSSRSKASSAAASEEAIRLEVLQGAALAARIDTIAALRIEVFREWPYLYAGSQDYEAAYLATYQRSPRSLAILAWSEGRCIGASTVLPLADADAAAQRPFVAGGYDVSTIDYFGESVIRRPYRGRGIGVRFFEAREGHARELKLPICAFCAVRRPDDHPARPRDDAGNEAFWRRRGYRPVPELVTTFSWTDLGDPAPSAKPMGFWMRRLDGTA